LADPLLVHADQMLHFNWVALYLLTLHHPALQLLGAVAYQSIYAIPAALLVQFAWSGKRTEAHRFLVAFWLAAVMTLLLFRWLPAAGPLAEFWKGPVPYMPQSALYQAHIIPLLQEHRLRVVDLDTLHGLVSAPSFHAASGVLFILFARKLLRVRVPLIGLSLLMLAATPIEGTHYLVDVIAGGLVALLAYAATGLPQLRSLWDQQPRLRSAASLAPERKRQHA
jgi:membrane-associated phospholipid phosphatase